MKLKAIATFCIINLALITVTADPINITIKDGKNYGGSSWYNTTNEDQEVEPGMIANQNWDLEAFMLDGSDLSVVGGFNFQNGYLYGGRTYLAGDIFIDLNGDANSTDIVNNYGYEFALDMDYGSSTYDVIDLTVGPVAFDQGVTAPNGNYASRPYRIAGTDVTAISGMNDLSLFFSDGGEYGFAGGTHYEVGGIDLSFLNGKSYTLHTTLSCGNDMMKGAVSVPEPGTLSLLGLSLLSLAGLTLKKKN